MAQKPAKPRTVKASTIEIRVKRRPERVMTGGRATGKPKLTPVGTDDAYTRDKGGGLTKYNGISTVTDK